MVPTQIVFTRNGYPVALTYVFFASPGSAAAPIGLHVVMPAVWLGWRWN